MLFRSSLLNQFCTVISDIAHRHAGTIFNMAGDCLMVAFNVLIPQIDAIVRAARAADAMLSEFEKIATVWRTEYGIDSGLGIGINEGDVVAGNVGSPSYMNFTLIGDAVNTASRLKDRARAGEFLFPERVMHALRDTEFSTRAQSLPAFTLKGKSHAVKTFAVAVSRRRAYAAG